ncbi:hypothetical protein EVAR_56065_1 [Eumeta japonica]|uniref:Uncharacterized protein n=1 Tax=Eumeta variegata TaxID=151549 RepID=A0A4C1YSZ9_EUMVA|nr:hypothetical protein EVAR_56065_1 [Eumeta japonica]
MAYKTRRPSYPLTPEHHWSRTRRARTHPPWREILTCRYCYENTVQFVQFTIALAYHSRVPSFQLGQINYRMEKMFDVHFAPCFITPRQLPSPYHIRVTDLRRIPTLNVVGSADAGCGGGGLMGTATGAGAVAGAA